MIYRHWSAFSELETLSLRNIYRNNLFYFPNLIHWVSKQSSRLFTYKYDPVVELEIRTRLLFHFLFFSEDISTVVNNLEGVLRVFLSVMLVLWVWFEGPCCRYCFVPLCYSSTWGFIFTHQCSVVIDIVGVP